MLLTKKKKESIHSCYFYTSVTIVMAEKPVIKNRERERDLFGPKCTNLSEARVKELEI